MNHHHRHKKGNKQKGEAGGDELRGSFVSCKEHRTHTFMHGSLVRGYDLSGWPMPLNWNGRRARTRQRGTRALLHPSQQQKPAHDPRPSTGSQSCPGSATTIFAISLQVRLGLPWAGINQSQVRRIGGTRRRFLGVCGVRPVRVPLYLLLGSTFFVWRGQKCSEGPAACGAMLYSSRF
jgi:hypothetical protein